MNITIIGAGVIGSSLAYRLAQRGAAVTLVDRARPAYGTSGSSFAWTNSNDKPPRDYHDLNVAGMRAHLALRDELGAAPWFREGGNLVWYDTPAEMETLEAQIARLQGWGYRAEWIDRAAVADLEPNLRLDDATEQVAWFPDEGMVDGPALAGRLAELAVDHGAVTRFAHEVVAIGRDGERITGVRFPTGETIDADLVVNCAGPAAGRIAQLAGRTLPFAPTPGLLVRVSATHDAIQRVVHAPRIHLRPDAGGLLMLHHGDHDAGLERGDPIPPMIDDLFTRAAASVPALASARLSRWSVGIRPIPADGRTSAGLLPSFPGYAEIVTHSGITLGPLLGRLVAAEILDGVVDPLLANFRPERFGV
jgi:glycine/D-amino acid oxidase-like deaminating enzyme